MRQKQPDGGFGGVHARRAAQKGLGELVGAEVVGRHDVVVPSLVVGSVFPEWLTRWTGANEVDAWCSRSVAARCAFPMLNRWSNNRSWQLLGGGGHGPGRQVKTAAVAGGEHGQGVMPHRFRDGTGDRD